MTTQQKDGCNYIILCATENEYLRTSNIVETYFPEQYLVPRMRVVRAIKHDYPMTVSVHCCEQMGNVAAATKALHLVNEYNPTVMIMSGIAASIAPDKHALGDVVIPKQVDYRKHDKVAQKGQKAYDDALSNGFNETFMEDNVLLKMRETVSLPRLALELLKPLTVPKAMDLAKEKELDIEFKSSRGKADIYTEAVTSLNCGMVVNSSSFLNLIMNEVGRKTSILEMESYGYLSAFYGIGTTDQYSSTTALMVKAISDFAINKEAANDVDGVNWEYQAIDNAALVSCCIIDSHASGEAYT